MIRRRSLLIGSGAATCIASTGPASYLIWRHGKISALNQIYPSNSTFSIDIPSPYSAVIAIGDSRVSRWIPAPSLPEGLIWAARGIGGECLFSLRQRFIRDAISFRPRAIILQAGINDLVAASFLSNQEAEAIIRRMIRLYLEIAVLSDIHRIPLFLLTVLPPGRPSFFYRVDGSQRLSELTGTCCNIMRRTVWPKGVFLIDAHLFMADSASGLLSPASQLDTVHLSTSGYLLLNKIVGEGLVNMDYMIRDPLLQR